MEIKSFTPVPPKLFSLTFTRDEGWAITMALGDAYKKYSQAQDRDKWLTWAKELDKELRA